MKVGTLKRLQMIIERLLPPASREHVLGDLQERFQTTEPTKAGKQYFVDAIIAVPLVIWSQLRRTVDPRLLCLEALVLYSAIITAAFLVFGSDAPAFLNNQYGMLRIALPVLLTLVALMLASVYSTPRQQPVWNQVRQTSFALGIAFLSNIAIGSFVDGAAVPRWIMTVGAALALPLILTVRLLYAAAFFKEGAGPNKLAQPAKPIQMSLNEIRGKTQEFQNTVRGRNRREYAAALVVAAVFGFYIWFFPDGFRRAGSGLVIVGTLYLVYQLRRRGSARKAPPDVDLAAYLRFYRTELERQRDLHHGIWSWYLAPLIPGLIVFGLGSVFVNPDHLRNAGVAAAVSATSAVLVFVLIWKLNKRKARQLQREIDALNSVEKQT